MQLGASHPVDLHPFCDRTAEVAKKQWRRGHRELYEASLAVAVRPYLGFDVCPRRVLFFELYVVFSVP